MLCRSRVGRRGASSIRFAILGVLSCLGDVACSDSTPSCAENVRTIEACLEADFVACETPYDECWTACAGRGTCDELVAARHGNSPPWLDACASRCVKKFLSFTCPDDGRLIDPSWVCDGDEDCVDGADESDCRYFECDEGGLIRAESECDEWADCGDRSDEEHCGYFLCSDNQMTVDDGLRCDAEEDCEDGSDELNCP